MGLTKIKNDVNITKGCKTMEKPSIPSYLWTMRTLIQPCLIEDQIYLQYKGGVVKVDIYEVDTKIELYVDTF